MAVSREMAMVLLVQASVGAAMPAEVKVYLADVQAKANALEESALRLGSKVEPVVELSTILTLIANLFLLSVAACGYMQYAPSLWPI